MAQCWLADPILEFVVLPTFGTYAPICAEFTIGYAGQAGILTPVRMESPGAVCPTATLVEETLLSIFIFLYALIFLLGLTGNALVAFVVLRNKAMQTITNIFITNLAISGLCSGEGEGGRERERMREREREKEGEREGETERET